METESVRRSERGATSVACTFISVVVLYGISGCSRDVRGGAPARGSIASADTPNEFQRHAPDNAPGARTAMGCGAVLNSERCVELALNVAIDPERITEHAVAVQVSTEGGLQPVAVPYGRFFVGVPRGYDTEGRGDRSRSVVVAGTSIPLVDALALSLLPHEQVLSGLRGFPDAEPPKTSSHDSCVRRRVISLMNPTSTHAFELSIDLVYSLESSRPRLIQAKDRSTRQRSGIGVNPGRSVTRVRTSTRTPVDRLASSTIGPE